MLRGNIARYAAVEGSYVGSFQVGDNFDGSNQPEPDNDPMDCTGHGTFVTGIIVCLPIQVVAPP